MAVDTKPASEKAASTGWSEILLSIAERSQKLIREFVERNNNDIVGAMFPDTDPGHIMDAFVQLTNRLAAAPERVIDAQIDFWRDYIKLCRNSLALFSGEKNLTPVIEPDASDRRFKDEAWAQVWLFDYMKQSYLLTAKLANALIADKQGLSKDVALKVDFFTKQIVDAMAPTNFWLTNPEVLRETMETGGENLIRGLNNLLQDLERGHGDLVIKLSQHEVFKLGENIGTSKGKVVYQNDLFQLIQYDPLTPKVKKTPFLIIPPWINKFYILDLKEKNSFVRYLVSEGHTVFMVSWVNPDERHANVGFEDYMDDGVIQAMRMVGTITKEPSLNILGYCIGGTLVATTLAYLKGLGNKRPADVPQVASATYLVVLVDFTDVGDIKVFIDEPQIKMLEAKMSKKGYLPASALNLTFNMLRANDLLWNFVVNNYLLGKEPFPFDLLTWNSDSTNLPAKMQSYYLRNMYMENNLVKPNKLSMKGVPIDLGVIDTPSYIVGTREDHITPWRSVYVGTQIYNGPVTFILAKSGHIAGVINPPAGGKYGYWTNTQNPVNPDDFLKGAEEHNGSWWPEWMGWLNEKSGAEVPARTPGENAKVLEEAPGSYVRVRAI